jgi:hypothetical protein
VELPLCTNSAIENFKSAGISASRQDEPAWLEEARRTVVTEHVGEEKPLEIELQTITQISRTQQETMPLKNWERQLIDGQLNNLKTMLGFFDFTEES